jgi:hypothetical protein
VTSLTAPETCVSAEVTPTDTTNSMIDSNATPVVATKLDPIDSSLFSIKQEAELPVLLSDEEKNADDFGEFLLDAVQWL